ncbi:MAG: hypothetical protein NPIRA02_10080 [Nitrospirales bacterium]|nr:MAG: hypothetical protein NPIRA02_10080 [Nitrospirales bacterium]
MDTHHDDEEDPYYVLRSDSSAHEKPLVAQSAPLMSNRRNSRKTLKLVYEAKQYDYNRVTT